MKKIETELESTLCPFGSLSTCCTQCSMGPCHVWRDDLPLHLKLLHRKKTKGSCGDTLNTILAKNILSSLIKGTVSTSIYAKHIASFLLDNSTRQASIKNEGKLEQIAKKLDIIVDKKEIAQKALCDIENSEHNPMTFISKYFPKLIMQNLTEINILPHSTSSEILSATHLLTMGTSSNPEDFLMQSFRLGLANLGTMIIASELQDAILPPAKLFTSKAGLGILDKDSVNIMLLGHLPLLGDRIIELSKSEEILNIVKTQEARGINVFGMGCVGNELLGRHGLCFGGSADQQEFAINTGLVEVVAADFGCVYPHLEEMVKGLPCSSFHTKFIRYDQTKDIDNMAKEIVDTAIKNFTNRKKFCKVTKPPITFTKQSFSAGFSFDECLGILTRLNPKDPLKPLLDWLVSNEIRGFALLIGCTKLNDAYIQIIKELLKKNILILTVGCSSYSCLEAGFLDANAIMEYTGRELGNVLCKLAKTTNIERALPSVWHFGSMIDFAHILNLLFAISTRLQIKLKDIPIVAIVNELGIEMPSAIGFGILSLGIPVHFGFNESIIRNDLITKILTEKVSELFEGRIILETDPSQAAKLLIGSIDEKRMGLNI
ncbi:MAG: hypothetical protein ABIF11_04795 [Nitrospirota bacterium]